ncbi:Ig-like domain-containing protein, partial [Roseobacter sp. HKCCA2468]|uniref:Ig-like domain-containing protein n=1 Tax=Roseobacter sp. HKCCA2468 TaxID=3120342 RepID=UPI0030EC11B2
SITFTGTFSEAVTVTGTPGLNLSNGGVARYVSGSGSSLLVFKYDVTGSSQSSADLDVVSLNVADGAFKSAVTGNAATVQVAPGILSFDADVLVDTSRPSGTISIDKTSLIANEVASVTVTFDEEVEDPRSAITVLNGTLSDLVGGSGDETGARSRVWTGTFTPALGIEDPTNALVLDNSKVFDDAGNPGIGLAASANFLIDTRGPVPVVSSVAQADGSRLLTVDFGEAVTDLSESGLIVENGVAGTFSKLSDSKYTLSVTSEASNPSGSITLSLSDNVIQDALGNYNDPFSASFVWDETAPVIDRITSAAASYTTGQDIYIDVEFNEPVTVSPIYADAGSNPILALSNGQVAHYASGSGTTSLRFRYTVQRGDEASDLDSLALVENASRIHDISGNDAQVKITPGVNNLAFATNIVIDGVVPSITNVSADDGLYQAGDEVLLDVQFSEDVTLDDAGGAPILALSNGSYASFVSHDGDRMVFSYAVATGDNDAQDLDVLGFAENGSVIADASGNRANVAIRFGMNNLAERNEVNIDAARPQIAETSANAGEYKAGQQIEIALAMSKGVVVDTTQGDPSLELNNGREAIFDAEKSTPTTLWFVYDVLATDVREDAGTLYEEYDLSIKDFKYNNAEIRSLIGGADAQMTLPLSGLASEAVRIDLTLPEVVSISLSDTSLSAGEDADVTVVLSEPVRQLDVSYFSVPHGSLSSFTTTDNITWHAVYTPVRDIEADELVISLDASRLSDEAGNLGLGEAQSGSYSLDSTYPELEIRSDALGVVHRGQDVRFTLQFSEAVTGFTDADVKVVNGEKVAFSFDGPNAEGEYSIMVRPLEGSRQPIKVYVEAGAAADGAGNLSRASSVFVQPVDTDPPKIEKIAGVKGSYALGDTISIDVTFTEAVTLQLEPDLSQHVLPHLSLNNGQEARYVAGSGGKTWTFEYEVSTPEDVTQLVDRETLRVLALVENDTSLLDVAGNKLEDYFVEASNQLNAGISVDTTSAVITGFSSVDGTYKTDDVLYIYAHLSELVRVQGTPAPYLTLSNGGRATYLSGTGHSRLVFKYTVDEADGNTSDLSVVSFNAPDAGIVDRAGNVTDLSIVSGDNDL